MTISHTTHSQNKRRKTAHLQECTAGSVEQSSRNASRVAKKSFGTRLDEEKGDHDFIPNGNSHELDEDEEVSDSASTGNAPKIEKDVSELPLVFWAAMASAWVPVLILGKEAASAIWARFGKTYLSDDRKRRDYASSAKGKDAVADRCVNRVVFWKCSGKSTFAEGNKDCACDNCVNARRLCARLINGHGNERSLGFYPLPDTDRTGNLMRELDHWVIDGRKSGLNPQMD